MYAEIFSKKRMRSKEFVCLEQEEQRVLEDESTELVFFAAK